MPMLKGQPSDLQTYRGPNGQWYVHYMQDGKSVQIPVRDKADGLRREQEVLNEMEKWRSEDLEASAEIPVVSEALGKQASFLVPRRVVADIAPSLAPRMAGKTLPLGAVVAHIRIHGSTWGGKGKGPTACEAYWASSPILHVVKGTKREAARALTYKIASALQAGLNPSPAAKKRYYCQKSGGDDIYSWAVFDSHTGRAVVNGQSRNSARSDAERLNAEYESSLSDQKRA